MAKVITVTNQKGGVGKTTTTEAIGVCLKEKGMRVLCIDLDPQGNLSFSVDAETEYCPNIYNVIKDGTPIRYAIQKNEAFDLITANILLSSVEIEFTQRDREFLLKTVIEPIQDRYDYILIDTPPSLSILTINAFAASDCVVIPMVADVFSLQGIAELNETILRVKQRCNPKLRIEGVLLTKYNARSNLTKDILLTAERVAERLQTKIFNQKIRTGCAIAEAQARQIPFLSYAPKSNVMKDYMAFVDELTGKGV